MEEKLGGGGGGATEYSCKCVKQGVSLKPMVLHSLSLWERQLFKIYKNYCALYQQIFTNAQLTFLGNTRSRKKRRRRRGRRRGCGSESRSFRRRSRSGTWRGWGVSRRRSRRSCRWRLRWRRGGSCWLSATWNLYGLLLSCWPRPRYGMHT